MNIHPLIVHFPIALLTTYAVLELIRFRIVTSKPYWFYIKVTLLILGTLASYAAILAGLIAKSLISNPDILYVINRHEFFGITTSVIFTLISLIYIRAWIKQVPDPKKQTLFLAILGLTSIFITGALGGSIVYGPTNDPVTNWIYNLIIGSK